MGKKVKKIKRLLLIIIIIIVGDVFFELNFPYVDEEALNTNKIDKGSQIRILSITDVHSNYFGEGNRKLSKLIGKCEFDLIAVTGDVADFNDDNQEEYINGFFDMLLKFDKPIFYVSGNHEEWKSWQKISKNLIEKGINVLINDHIIFEKDKNKINICGIEDFNTKYHDLDKAMSSIENHYTILLSHSPGIIYETDSYNIDLVLSGHTHGGQVRIPFLFKDSKEINKHSKGLYKTDSGYLYIDSGLSTTRFPIRFLNRSKITLLKIIGRSK